jgi:hypothetical protein
MNARTSFTVKTDWSRQMKSLVTTCVVVAGLQSAPAIERIFTYTYEPETLPQGVAEFEQWVTLRTGRSEEVGQENYNRWDLREEFEYGVTDIYSLALYLNFSQQSYYDPTATTDRNKSDFEFKGVSLENIVNVLNPATHPVGLSLYLEPSYSGEEAEVEEKIILGQRHGDWKWALNLSHATEWENNLHDVEGEFEATAGVARFLGKHWSVGLEARSLTKMPDYSEVESTAVFFGPVVSYRQERWWATLTVLPQVFGRNWDGVNDGSDDLDLAQNERVNIRLIFGIEF